VTSFRTVCTIQAAASLSSGALLLLVPWPALVLFAIPTDAGTQLVARMLGGVLFALGATLLGAREVTEPAARTRIMLGNAVCDACIAIQIVASLATHTLPGTGWILAALFAANAGSWVVVYRSTPR
jgi:hypothetical protein